MKNKITESTALYGLGYPFGRNLFKLPAGAFSGRMAALIQTGPASVALFHADPPYSDWSEPLTVDNDIANDGIDAVMDSEGNILIVYPAQTTGYLTFRKLSYADGTWTAGSAVVVYNGGSCSSSSIVVEPDGRIWVSFALYVQPNRHLHVKASSDDGGTWGSGSGDAGTELCSGYLNSYSRLLMGNSVTCIIYTAGSNYLRFRSVAHGESAWSGEGTVASGTGLDRHFDAGVFPDGRVGVVFDDLSLKYREYDGANWGALQTLDESTAYSPQLLIRQNAPAVVYLAPWTGDRCFLKCLERRSAGFEAPVFLDGKSRCFDTVLLYSSGSASYEDVTTAAANAATADVIHSSTGRMLRDAGDTLYAGLDTPFRFIEVHLTTAGLDGTLQYSYWDGEAWRSFVPVSGDISFGSIHNDIVLFADYDSLPVGWQRKSVDGRECFWIKMEVSASFSTGPMGDYLTSVSNVTALSFRR